MDLKELKPWELIRVAVADMKATIASGIQIDMTSWGVQVGTPECTVCFAGSVMLQKELSVCLDPKSDSLSPSLSEYNDIYNALDKLRKGDINYFLYKLNYPRKEIMGNIFVSNNFVYHNFKPYSTGNEEHFYSQMEEIAEILENNFKEE